MPGISLGGAEYGHSAESGYVEGRLAMQDGDVHAVLRVQPDAAST